MNGSGTGSKTDVGPYEKFAVNSEQKLHSIKIFHTAVWIFFVVCIVGIPLFAWFGMFRTSFLMIAIVMVEVIILAFNKMRCPLTDVAASYTDDRADNFDIFLPLVVARYNKHIFGPAFLAGTIYAIGAFAGYF